MVIISARGIGKAFGAKTLFVSADLTVSDGDRIGVVGINGTGKSTLLKILAGAESSDHGVIERRRDGDILYLPQEPRLDKTKSPRAIVAEGLTAWTAATSRYAEVSARIAEGEHDLVEEQATLSDRIDRLGGWDKGHLVETILEKLGVRDIDRAVGSMSGGEVRRVALAAILVAEPTLAILDEPTNHLDADSIDWLEDHLAKDFKGAVVMITHDRYALDAICNRIVEIDQGKVYEYRGTYSDFVEGKAERLAHADRVEAKRLNFLRSEIEWLRRGPKARTTKSKARIDRAHAVMAIEAPQQQLRVALGASVQRLGRTVLDLRNVTAKIGDRVLFSDLTLHLTSGQRIGIVGGNGVGKTTLLKIAAGEIAPSSGEVVRGVQTQVAYFDQARAALRDDWSVFDNVAERQGAEKSGGIHVNLGELTVPLRTYLERFLFDGAQQRQKVSALSGGERARVSLAKALKDGANLLLLDEPTNDLDTSTLGALEELLDTWPGSVLVVSHDRFFLNRIATSLLVFEDQKVIQYAGTYQDYRAETKKLGEPKKRKELQLAIEVETKAPAVKPLSFGEKKELDGLLDRIGEAEQRVASVQNALADPKLYATRGDEVKTLQAQLASAQNEVQTLSARWETLEARRAP